LVNQRPGARCGRSRYSDSNILGTTAAEGLAATWFAKFIMRHSVADTSNKIAHRAGSYETIYTETRGKIEWHPPTSNARGNIEVRFALMRSSNRLAEGSGLKALDPLLGLTHAKLARASVPRQSLSRIGGDAAYAGTAQGHRIEGRS
jgi:hypothetical protein